MAIFNELIMLSRKPPVDSPTKDRNMRGVRCYSLILYMYMYIVHSISLLNSHFSARRYGLVLLTNITQLGLL